MNTETVEPIALRTLPDRRWAEIPAQHNALLVRDDRPDRVLPPGRQRVRRLFQPQPELYTFPTQPQPLFLWVTDLFTAEGKAVNLSWKLVVEIADPALLWQHWLQFQEDDHISAPGAAISGEIADAVQELVQRHGLEELRTDADIRRIIGGQISLRLREELTGYGLAIARQLDYQHLRFQTDADLTAAEVERETLGRMLEDARLQSAIHRLDNAEVLTYRLREWLEQNQATLSPQTLDEIARETLDEDNEPGVAEVLQQRQADRLPDLPPTPAVVNLEAELNRSAHEGRWHVLHHLSHFILIATALAALVLAVIAIFEPGMLATDEQRARTAGIVGGTAFIGLFVAWMVDQILRWEARKTARRLLEQANLNHADEETNRLEVRHILILLAALLALTGATVSLWLPDLYPWLRLGGAGVGLLGAVIAIRYDWLRNLEHSRQEVRRAWRTVAGVRLQTPRITAEERARRHARTQADLNAEVQASLDYLDEARQRVFREMKERPLYARIQRVHERIAAFPPRIQAMQAAADAHYADGQEDSEVARQRAALSEEVRRCGELAQAVYWYAQQKEVNALADRLTELEQSALEAQSLLARWDAVAL